MALTCLLPLQAQDTAPASPADEYARTEDALMRYRVMAAEDDGELLPAIQEPVQPGDRYEGVPRLIRLLRRLGDLPDDAVLQDEDVYDGPLVTAIQRFQRRHGLDPDGLIGEATLEELNTPLANRVHQLELALEYQRRIPFDASGRAIVLNLPEFRLRAYREGRVELEMKIVVGKAPDRKTPILSSQLDAVIFRPYWNVPARIQREEMVPAIARDRSYLEKHDLEMVNTQGVVIAGPMSDETFEELRAGTLRLRQRPGPQNSLGLAKFVFPNEYDVYMHDTPVRWVFERERRDFSHGCIRVEQAETLAEWVLGDEPGWTQERIVDAMQGDDPIPVRLTHPIPVVTTYATAVVQDDGEVYFFPDIYSEEAVMERAAADDGSRKVAAQRLKKKTPARLPVTVGGRTLGSVHALTER